MSTPETAELGGRTVATITAAARTVYPYDGSPDDLYAHAKEQLDKAERKDFAALGTIADALLVFGRGQRRDLR